MFRDLTIYNHSFHHLLAELQERASYQQKTFLVTLNPVIYIQGQRDPQYKDILQHADYITPDGIGIVKASKWLHRPVHERITGFDLMTQLLHLANQHKWRIYLLGSTSTVVSKTSVIIAENYPNIVIAGYHHGYFTNDEEIINEIKDGQPDLVFVAMGCPRQEKWIHDNIDRFSKGIFIGVGGSFDVISGLEKRAPQPWINLNVEWLYRILNKPDRILMIPKLVLFILLVLKESIEINGIAPKRKVMKRKG